MRNSYATILIPAALIVGIGLGAYLATNFWVGSKKGLMQSQAETRSTIENLRDLRENRINEVIESEECKLDILIMELNLFLMEKRFRGHALSSLKQVADYRSLHPHQSLNPDIQTILTKAKHSPPTP